MQCQLQKQENISFHLQVGNMQTKIPSESTKTKRAVEQCLIQDHSHITPRPENSLGTFGENIKKKGSQQNHLNQANVS